MYAYPCRCAVFVGVQVSLAVNTQYGGSRMEIEFKGFEEPTKTTWG